MKCIIAGTRTFNNYELMKVKLNAFFRDIKVTIISGTAFGADRLGEKYAEENGFDIIKFPADWYQYGKKAGYIRNEQMAEIADTCIVFWDGKSKGSKHMIDIAYKKGLHTIVIIYYEDDLQLTRFFEE